MFQTIEQTQRHDLEKRQRTTPPLRHRCPLLPGGALAAFGQCSWFCLFLCYGVPLQVLLPKLAARGYEPSKLLNGTVAEVGVTTDLYANLRPTLIDGLRVEHQCRLRAVAAAGQRDYFVTKPVHLLPGGK